MKIGIESQRIFRSHKHGMDVVALELIRQIQQMDTTNEYHLYAKAGEDENCLNETANFQIHKLKSLTYGDWEQIALPRALRKHRPSLVHCTANTAPINCPVPLVLTLHDIIFLRETSFRGTAYQNFGNIYRRLIVPHAIKNARVIITVSEAEKQIICDTCGIAPAKIVVVHNAVNPRFAVRVAEEEITAFRRHYNLPDKFILLLGNTAPKKNTPAFLRAYVEYAATMDAPLPLVVADYPSSLIRQHLSENRWSERLKNIHVTGYVPAQQMNLLYRCATLFVYPSLMESFGLPVLEAMASEVPVITSHVPALQEVAGNAAVFIDPTSVRSMAETLAAVHTNENLQQNLRQKGAERAKLFSWKNSAERLLRIYRSVAENNFPD